MLHSNTPFYLQKIKDIDLVSDLVPDRVSSVIDT